MFSSVLHSEMAINMNIKIINAFVAMRKYVSTNLLEQKHIYNMVLEDHDKIRALEDSFQKFEEKRKSTEVYFNGQIYDAYADNTILDIERYNKQYNNLTVVYNNTFHDRYFIIDDEIVYHCGASINRISYKTFSITLIGNSEVKEALIKHAYKAIYK